MIVPSENFITESFIISFLLGNKAHPHMINAKQILIKGAKILFLGTAPPAVNSS
jgi:hypothetical protein